jgi:hypothetical protein
MGFVLANGEYEMQQEDMLKSRGGRVDGSDGKLTES